MKFQINELNQNSNTLYTSVLPFNYINDNSHVLVYGKDKGGYQREPDPKHFKKIKDFIIQNKEFIFPTSIILGIDSGVADKIITKEGSGLFINLELNATEKIFRIIDGQHRIKGIEESLKNKPAVRDLRLSIVILKTDSNKRSQEMHIFNTINSKSKRIKVDLIKLAEYDYRILENDIGISELPVHLSMKVAQLLNEDYSENNIWQNAIKFGIHDEDKIGIIGVNAFIQSIESIVSQYLNKKEGLENMGKNELLNFVPGAGSEIKDFICQAWDIVRIKWSEGIFPKKQVVQVGDELATYYYKKNYYLQKTLGTKAINYTLGQILKDGNKKVLHIDNLDKFKDVINSSKILNRDWEMGVTFSGYSSESAFTKVRKMIMGELNVPRN